MFLNVLQSRFVVLGEIMSASGHPASGFHSLCDCVMIRIFLIMGPRVPADHSIRLDQSNHENHAANHFIERDVAHSMVAVVQFEVIFTPENACDFGVIALVPKYVLANASGCARPGASPISALQLLLISGA